MTDLAAALLRDVPTRYQPVNGDRLLHETDVLAALTAALDGVDERAGEIVSELREVAAVFTKDTVFTDAADLITALLAQNAALRAERDTARAEMKFHVDDAVKAWNAAEAAEAEVERLRAKIAFTATDGQRLLRKIDVIGVCDDPDLCFDSEGSVARCGPCAVKIAARDGVVLNQYTCSNPQAMRLRRELTAAEAQIATLTARVERLTGALYPLSVLPIGDRTADDVPLYGLDERYITHGDIRRARAALTTEADNG